MGIYYHFLKVWLLAIQKYGNFLSITITDLVNKARKDKKKKYQNMVDEFILGI